jgi:hypothetical protein
VTCHPRDQSARQHFRPNGPLLPSPRSKIASPQVCGTKRKRGLGARSARAPMRSWHGSAVGISWAQSVSSADPRRLTRPPPSRKAGRPTSPLCVTEPIAASADGARQAERCLSVKDTRRAASMLLRGAVPMLKRGKPGKHCVRSSAQIIGDSVEFPRHRNIRR